MKKRLLSLFLALAMVLTMMPAELMSKAAVTPYIGWSQEITPTSGNIKSTFDTAKGYETNMKICLVDENGDVTKLMYKELEIPNDSVIEVSADSPDSTVIYVKTKDWGSTVISYVYNDTPYNLSFVSEIQDNGFYSAPSRTRDNWITEFTVTDTDNTFYFLLDPAVYKQQDFGPTQALEDIATVTWDSQYHGYTVIIDADKEPEGGKDYGFIHYDSAGNNVGNNYLTLYDGMDDGSGNTGVGGGSTTAGAVSGADITVTPNGMYKYTYPAGMTESQLIIAVDAVSATNDTNFSYQWYCDGVAIPGATSKQYTILNASQDVSYYCEVTNSVETVQSVIFTLTFGSTGSGGDNVGNCYYAGLQYTPGGAAFVMDTQDLTLMICHDSSSITSPVWRVGTGLKTPDERVFTAGVEYTVDANDPTKITLHGEAIKAAMVNMDAFTVEVSAAEGWTHGYTMFLKETYYRYHYPLSGMNDTQFLVQNSRYIENGMHVDYQNLDTPDGGWDRVEITQVVLTAQEDIEGNAATDIFAVIPAGDGWDLIAQNPGKATVEITYRNVDNALETYTIDVYAMEEQYILDLIYTTGTNDVLVGDTLQVGTLVRREYAEIVQEGDETRINHMVELVDSADYSLTIDGASTITNDHAKITVNGSDLNVQALATSGSVQAIVTASGTHNGKSFVCNQEIHVNVMDEYYHLVVDEEATRVKKGAVLDLSQVLTLYRHYTDASGNHSEDVSASSDILWYLDDFNTDVWSATKNENGVALAQLPKLTRLNWDGGHIDVRIVRYDANNDPIMEMRSGFSTNPVEYGIEWIYLKNMIHETEIKETVLDTRNLVGKTDAQLDIQIGTVIEDEFVSFGTDVYTLTEENNGEQTRITLDGAKLKEALVSALNDPEFSRAGFQVIVRVLVDDEEYQTLESGWEFLATESDDDGPGNPSDGNQGGNTPPAGTVEVIFEGNDGEFTVTDGVDSENYGNFGDFFPVGSTFEDTGLTILDPVFWDATRAFKGWQVMIEVPAYDEDGNEVGTMLQPLDGVGLLTTAELMKYEIPDIKVIFVAQWAGNDDDYYTSVWLDLYGGLAKFDWGDWIEETDNWGNRFHKTPNIVGTTLYSQLGRYIIGDPYHAEYHFEGWLMKDDEWNLLSKDLYTTDQILGITPLTDGSYLTIQNDNIIYQVKWEEIPMDEYLKNIQVDELPEVDPSQPVEEVTVGVNTESAMESLDATANDIVEKIETGNDNSLNGLIPDDVIDVIRDAVKNKKLLAVVTGVSVDLLSKNELNTAEVQNDMIAIESAAGNATIAQYLDLKVNIKATSTDDNGKKETKEGNISELNEPIEFEVAIPEALREAMESDVPEGHSLVMFILYRHGNKVYRIDDVSLNESENTLMISFPAYQFSTYALAYEYKANSASAPTPQPTPTPQPQQPSKPQSSQKPAQSAGNAPTGDTAPVMLYTALVVVSVMALAVIESKRRALRR